MSPCAPRVLLALLIALGPATDSAAQQVTAQDIDQILDRADKLLEESKSAYEEARAKSSVAAFVDAGFKLEEARIKYLVLQEIGSPEKQKIAADRLRAVNQLGKLIHDGKVAISGPPPDPAAPKAAPPPALQPAPAEPAPRPEPKPAGPAPDITKRLAIPDPAKQKEAEKQVKELFREQYAKKAPGDRQALARSLLDQAAKTPDDPAAQWVLLREAQDSATQGGDVKTAIAAAEGAARLFDVDGHALKGSVLASMAKAAKSPDECLEVCRELLKLVDEVVAVDLYDQAEKAVNLAQQLSRRAADASLTAKTTARGKEIAEAKTRFQALKTVLQTLAKTPDDPAANSEMGQFLCFVKGNWDLGPRFLVKGSDVNLKKLSEKELDLPTQSADLAALADGWLDLGEKEKSPLRKGQMLSHARVLYDGALVDAQGLLRARIEKRLEAFDAPAPGSINLLRMIDPVKDAVAGSWSFKDGKLWSDSTLAARIEIPYSPPTEYDFTVVFVRHEGSSDVIQILSKSGKSFQWAMASGANLMFGFGMAKGTWPTDAGSPAAVAVPGGLSNGQTYTSLVQVRKDGVKAFIDGKLVKEYKTSYEDLASHSMFRLRNESLLGIASFKGVTIFQKIELVEVSGKGKRLR